MSSQKEYQPVEMEEGVVVAQVVAEQVPTATPAVLATALPMIQVIAPATLPEGYTFEAEVGGRVITVTVVSITCNTDDLLVLSCSRATVNLYDHTCVS